MNEPRPAVGADPMAAVRAELCAHPVAAHGGAAVHHELACLLRLAALPVSTGAPDSGKVTSLSLELPDAPVVRRLARLVAAIGAPTHTLRVAGTVAAPTGRSPVTGQRVRRHRLRVIVAMLVVGPRLGLLTSDGRLVPGLPVDTGAGGRAAATAAWRAAVLSRGEGHPSARWPVLGLCCPNEAVARQLAHLARALDVLSATRVRAASTGGSPAAGSGTSRAVMVRAEGVTDVDALLRVMGAPRAATRWEADPRPEPAPHPGIGAPPTGARTTPV